MKVFVSWSGERGGKMADALVVALKTTLQAVKPWFSRQDIKGGDLWFQEIQAGLRDSRFAIVCLTSDSMTSNWVHFESGAIAFQMDKAKVAPLLLDVGKADLVPPLGMFQGARYDDREDVGKLFKSLNDALPDGAGLDADVLKEMSALFFDKLQAALKPIETQKSDVVGKKAKRTDREMLEEVLGHVRTLANRVEFTSNVSMEAPVRNDPSTYNLATCLQQRGLALSKLENYLELQRMLEASAEDGSDGDLQRIETGAKVRLVTQQLAELDGRIQMLEAKRRRSSLTDGQLATLRSIMWKLNASDGEP